MATPPSPTRLKLGWEARAVVVPRARPRISSSFCFLSRAARGVAILPQRCGMGGREPFSLDPTYSSVKGCPQPGLLVPGWGLQGLQDALWKGHWETRRALRVRVDKGKNRRRLEKGNQETQQREREVKGITWGLQSRPRRRSAMTQVTLKNPHPHCLYCSWNPSTS